MRNHDFENVPGWELVNRGLEDISQGHPHTTHALLVFMAAPRLRFLGIDIPNALIDRESSPPHHELYKLLEKTTSDAYSQYNALQRRLVSFCRSVENAYD
ncbi:MAG: hypothetical protein HYS08_10225 [Chlamydiae bacterium]|nr:hypothetical protein [Chlamydiota bacterium]MBI3266270.1 hypothetical protein [Chlamydiota bacterium]